MSSQFQATLTPTIADFVGRHVGPDATDVEEMLRVVGQPSLEAMCDRAIPGAIRSTESLGIEAADSESAVIEELRALASRNRVLTSLIGLGYYGTITPPVVRRNVFENPAWYTAYTPYQPEISQGRLEALLNFQTAISDLTGLEIAGSSLLDEATAAAEAMTLVRRGNRKAAGPFVVDAPGYCTRTPQSSPSGRPPARSATTTSMPIASARVRTTSMV